jgi:hypothetical protein
VKIATENENIQIDFFVGRKELTLYRTIPGKSDSSNQLERITVAMQIWYYNDKYAGSVLLYGTRRVHWSEMTTPPAFVTWSLERSLSQNTGADLRKMSMDFNR